MADYFLNIDINLFYFINHTLSNHFFNNLMPFITNVRNWYLVYVFLFGWLIWKGGQKGRIAALTLVLTIVLTDQVNSHLIKELVGRLRPCHVLANVNLLVGCGPGKSFPSSHAANNFAAAAILSYFYKQYKITYFIIAGIIAFSRVYVGVHYPSDIAGGAILGFCLAAIIIIILKRFYRPE